MPTSVSILIPTHNRCDILEQTLKSLSLIDQPVGVAVELVVVANACTDRTRQVVEAAAASLAFKVKCIDEPEPGLSVARNRCMAESDGEIVMFLDDDVWVEPQWLCALLGVYDTCPADIVGGPIHLWWAAVDRPTWFVPEFDTMLSGIDHGDSVMEFKKEGTIWGANFSFRRKVYDTIGGFNKSLGRVGSGLRSGEEVDFMQRAIAAKFRLFYAPRAALKHWVAPQRASLKYISKVAVGNGEADVLLTAGPMTFRCAMHILYYNTRWVLGFGVMETYCQLVGDPVRRVRYRLRGRLALGRLKALAGMVKP